jgi:hypothetical protein
VGLAADFGLLAMYTYILLQQSKEPKILYDLYELGVYCIYLRGAYIRHLGPNIITQRVYLLAIAVSVD